MAPLFWFFFYFPNPILKWSQRAGVLISASISLQLGNLSSAGVCSQGHWLLGVLVEVVGWDPAAAHGTIALLLLRQLPGAATLRYLTLLLQPLRQAICGGDCYFGRKAVVAVGEAVGGVNTSLYTSGKHSTCCVSPGGLHVRALR